MAGQPRAFKSVKELEKGVDSYFAECNNNEFVLYRAGSEIKTSEPLTVSGLASSLGVDRMTLFRYAKGEYGDQYCDTIKKARAKIERDKLAKAMLGFYDKTICIFDLKNNHGWKDREESSPEDRPPPTRIEIVTIDGRKQD